MGRSQHLIVVAIDFGTTFSGFAFSFRNQHDDDPTNVSGIRWRGKASLKAPTCILLDPSKKFKAFGYDAEDKHADLVSKQEHKNWCFVKHFKMQLYTKNLNRDIAVKDASGNEVLAMTIFTEAIRYLKDEAFSMCAKQVQCLKNEDVHWVLTTPAIWGDNAKQFMREAAHKAGINGKSLVIALEPEVASIYCRNIPIRTDEQTEARVVQLPPGSKYAVLDAGGGTIDIVVHEVNEDGTIKEIHQAIGGSCGGTSVDEAFLRFITKIIGEPKMIEFQDDYLEDYLDFMRDFEILKHAVSPKSLDTVRIRVPTLLSNALTKRIKDGLAPKDIKDVVKIERDRMFLSASSMQKMFEKPIKQITQYIETILNKIHSVSHVLMVGGFSESPMLQESIRSAVKGRNVQVVIPGDTSNAILKGAVIYGHDPSFITHRTTRYTYGVETRTLFIEGKHEKKRKITDKRGVVRCKGGFSIHVTKGQVMCCNEWLDKQPYLVISADQTTIDFDIFSSTVNTPIYTDEPGCVRLGTLTIPMPDTTDGLNRGAYVQFCYSGAELLVRATNKQTGETVEHSINFLG